MGREQRVLILVHPKMDPRRKTASNQTERDVFQTLNHLGHKTEVVAIQDDLKELDKELARARPDIVFNLLEEFRDEGVFDFHVVTYLESLGIPYTGCNPRGLIVSRNKLWVSHIAAGSGILAPETQAVRARAQLASVKYPAFIKFNREHASLGITTSNRVVNESGARVQTRRMASVYPGELIIQDFIAGQEVSVSVLGNDRPRALNPWSLTFKKPTQIATERIKFGAKLRFQKGIQARRYNGPAAAACKGYAVELFRLLDLSGYARFDFRVRGEQTYLIDVNPNPNLSRSEDLAASARSEGVSYEELIEQCLDLGKSYQPAI